MLIGTATAATITGVAQQSPPAPARADVLYTLQGRVYLGEVGDESTPLSGVTVSLYGANNPYPDTGTLITATTTNASGWYGLDVSSGDAAFEFYSIRETNPSGMSSVGATSVDGTIRDQDWIEYDIPLAGKTLTGNKFWDQSDAGPSPTPGTVTFEGRVFAGEVGDESSPLVGATVALYGANNAYPDEGSLLTTATTNGIGWYGLTVATTGLNWEYFHIRHQPPSGYAAHGATSVDGVVRAHDWIEYVIPLAEKTLTGNRFWDVTGSTPTPSPTPTQTPGPTTVTICAVADATVSEVNPGAALGLEPDLLVGYGTGPGEAFARRTLLRFDLSFVPPGTVVEDAVLELGQIGADGLTPVLIRAYPLRDAWDEATVTWSSQPAADSPAIDQASLDLAVPSTAQWNVRDLVRDWLDGSRENNGLQLRGPESGTFWTRAFDSRHYRPFCPRLVLTVSAPGPIPSPTPTPTATPTPTPTQPADVCPEPDGAGDSFAAASALTPGLDTDEYLCPSGEVDWWKFTADASQEISVFLFDLPLAPPADLDILLFDPNGVNVASSEIFGADKGGYIHHTAWVTGEWRVLVRGKGPADWSKTHTYSLRVDLKFNCDYPDEAGDTFKLATPILPSLPQASVVRKSTGYICPKGDVDFYKFPIAGDQSVTIDAYLTDLPADFDMILRKPDGTVADYSNNTGTTDEHVSASSNGDWGEWRVSVYGPYGTYHSYPYTLEVRLTSNADLTVQAIEVTQAIQDLQNSVQLVTGKPTMARVYVSPGAAVNWATPVEVELHGWYSDFGIWKPFAGSPLKKTQVTYNQTVSNTKRLDLGHSFNFVLPAGWTKSGTAKLEARVNPNKTLPETNYTNNSLADSDIHFRTTGTANVGFVIVSVNGVTPTLTNNADYTRMLAYTRQVYPAAQVTYWFRSAGPLSGSWDLVKKGAPGKCGDGWVDLLLDLQDIYDDWEDRPNNAILYGLVSSSVCPPNTNCTLGCGMLGTGVSAGLIYDKAAETLAHEVGHNFGRLHAPCSVPDPDPNYPTYPNPAGGSFIGGSIGQVGLNVQALQLHNPTTITDFMTYCDNPTSWISPYTWAGILGKMPSSIPVLLGAPVPHIIVAGAIEDGLVTSLRPFWIRDEPEGVYDGPGSGSYSIELRDAQDQSLFIRYFGLEELSGADRHDPGHFHEILPWNSNTASIVIASQGQQLTTVNVSSHAPTVAVTAPNGGQVWNGSGPFAVSWQMSDADGDSLRARVTYSADGGATWQPLAVNLDTTTLQIDGSALPGGTQALVRVEVSDGVRSSSDVSDAPFQVELKAPRPLIIAPSTGSLSRSGQPLGLAGFAADPEDGVLSGESLVWSSDRDGVLGTGETLAAGELSCGPHTITLAATDSDSMLGRTSVDVLVMGPCVAFVPASAHAAGAAGTSWVSDLVLHNPGTAGTSALLYFARRDAASLLEPPQHAAVPAGASLRLADVVEESFAQSSASGAILIGADRPLVLSSRTYNDAASGTFGQYIPGDTLDAAIANGERALLLQLTRSASYRTNVGVTNVAQQPIGITVDLVAADGTVLGQRTATVPALGHVQFDDVLAGLVFGDIADAYAVVRGTDSAAAFFTYASVIDNASGDPIYSAPATLAATPIVVPAAAHVAGSAGTNWRTDLEIANPLAAQATYRIELLRRDQDNSAPQTATYQLEAGRAVRYADILASVFAFEGAAALRIVPLEGEIAVSSRTYNQLSDRTFGQYIPGFPESGALSAGQEGRIVQLAHSPDAASGYRTNLGLTNGGSASITVEVALHDGGGGLLGARTAVLRPYEHRQLNDVFRDVTSHALDDAYASVTSSTAGARYFAYGSVVDNRSGDPIYVPARTVPAPAAAAVSGTARSSVAARPAGLARLHAALVLAVVAAAGVAVGRRRRRAHGRTLGDSPRRASATVA